MGVSAGCFGNELAGEIAIAVAERAPAVAEVDGPVLVGVGESQFPVVGCGVKYVVEVSAAREVGGRPGVGPGEGRADDLEAGAGGCCCG